VTLRAFCSLHLRQSSGQSEGRDVLEGMGAILFSPNSMVSQQMFQQDYNPLWGLRKYQQFRLYPVQPLGNQGRKGLGNQAMQHFE
jgi:hypothetical protein